MIIFDALDRKFHTSEMYLTQSHIDGVVYRRIKRAQLAEILRAGSLLDGGDCEKYSGKVDGNFRVGLKHWDPSLWLVKNFSKDHKWFPGQIWIGCVHFQAAQANRLRRWALAKRKNRAPVAARKKSSTRPKGRGKKGRS